MLSHPYGWTSLLPPIVAILLAIATRRVVASLVAGIFVGAVVTTQGDVWQAIKDTCEVHLWPTLVDPGRLRIFSFTLMMGAMIGVMTRCGGMRGLIEVVSPLASDRRRGQLTTWLLGMLIFFDDYANTILLGGTLRPICDRLKISREKLAYLVDSTAAPVAGLALVSTWVAVEIAYIDSGLVNIPGETGLDAFRLFIASIPYRFYMLLALAFVPLTAILAREFGPMLAAERACISGQPREQAANRAIEEMDAGDLVSPWYNAVLPILVTLAVVVVLIYRTGLNSLGADASGAELRDVIGAGDSSFALQYGALLGLSTVAILSRVQGLLKGAEIVDGAMAGARVVLPAIAILWCAAALSNMTGNKSVDGQADAGQYDHQNHRLYTGEYLKSVLTSDDAEQTDRSKRWLPTIVFVLAAAVAFCTGTSWGTMGILVPMVVSLTYAVLTGEDGSVSPADPILLCSIGGVLAGAVFGDHCSPLSDTTVLSSQSCGCDHIAHVWTQLPYALAVAGVSIGLGTIPIGWGISIWILLPLQLVALVVILLVFGRRVEI